MSQAKEDFKFMNSELWLKYTHEKYLNETETKYRIQKLPEDWQKLWHKITNTRKQGAVPVFLNSIGLKFWYFPSDSIQRKTIQLERLGTKLHDKILSHHKLKREFLIDAAVEEAITSAIYEGANTTRAKAKQLINSGNRPASKDDWMLLNNYEALNWIKEHRDENLTSDIILTIHQIVTKNTLDESDINYCGRFRDDTVYVNNALGKRVHEGISHQKIQEVMTEAIKVVTDNPRYIHPLIKGILLHYFIAYIHPFFDGNGRTARTLFYFKLMKHDLPFIELLSISAHLKNTGNRYEKSFEIVKNNDWDLTYFIDYCLESLLTAIRIVEGKVDYLISINVLKNTYHFSENQIGLLQRMVLNKYRSISIDQYASEIKKSREIARQELKNLLEKNFLKEQKQGKKLVYSIETKKLKEEVQKEIEAKKLLL